MSALLIFAVILLYSFQTLFCKLYTDRYPGRPDLASPVFCVLESVSIFLFTWAWRGFQFQADPTTVLLGFLNAVVLWGYNTFLIQASTRGSYAFLNVMMLFGGILVPIVYSTAFLNDPLKLHQIGAVVLMLAACVLMNLKEIKLKGTKPIYYLFCVLLFLSNGLYGVLLKVQSIHNEAQSNDMIMITFGIMGIIALLQLAAKERKNTLQAFRMNKKCMLPLVLCLLSAALAINALVYVLPLVNASVFYTVENGGVLVLSALYAVILFREKTSVSNVIGIILAVVSITVLSL